MKNETSGDFAKLNLEMSINLAMFPRLYLTEGIEILDNLPSEFDDLYSSTRRHTFKKPIDKATVIVLKGRSGAGKDGVDRQWEELEKADPNYQEWENKQGVELQRWRVRFSSAALAAQLEGRVPLTYLEAEDRFVVAFRSFTSLEYRIISNLMMEVVEYGINKLEGPREVRVQPSTPTGKIVNGKFSVDFDRGDSVEYKLATDENYKKLLHEAVLIRDPRSVEEILTFRRAVAGLTTDNILKVCKECNFNPVLINSDGEKKTMAEFTEEDLKWLVGYLPKMMAPAVALEKSDAQMQSVINQLHANRLIKRPCDQNYYYYMRRELNLSPKRCKILSNFWMGGPKTYYLNQNQGFGADDLVAHRYPALNNF